jgi:hypothetical protein
LGHACEEVEVMDNSPATQGEQIFAQGGSVLAADKKMFVKLEKLTRY